MAARCVLVADDNVDNRTVYVMILKHLGYRVLEAGNGEEAVRLATEELPDLVLMDLQMPGVNGFQATERLKGADATARIPVIAITALAMDQDREMAFAVGCDDYFAKPLEPRVLAEEVLRRIGPAVQSASAG